MNRSRYLIQFLSFGLGVAGYAQGLVSLPEHRTEILTGVTDILEREQIDFASREIERQAPFLAAEVEVPVASLESTAGEVALVSAPVPRLSDAAALTLAARSFKPSGSLITSSRRILRLDGGRMVNEGHVFGITIRAERYDVIIDSVSEDGYVLKIGEESIARSFIEANDHVQRVRTSQQ